MPLNGFLVRTWGQGGSCTIRLCWRLHVGPSWEAYRWPLEGIFEAPWGLSGVPRRPLGASWGRLGASWGLPGLPGDLLGPFGGLFEASWGPLGGILGASWGPLKASWGPLGGCLGLLGAS